MASLALTACGGGGGSNGGGSGGGDASGAIDNISGLVSESAGSSTIGGQRVNNKVSTMSVSGCTATAYDIDTNAVVATATTDASGKYIIEGVTAGSTYKVVVTCGSNSFSVVASAENSDPAEKDDDEFVPTNPRTTIIAAYIVKSIKEAVDEATDGLPAAAQDAVKNAILAALDNIVQTITETIEEAIESGAMEEPSLGTAKTVADGLKDANDAGAVDTTLGNASVSAPKSVDQAINGARQASKLKSACDSTLAGADINKCRRAMAQFMYNALGFSVVLLQDGNGIFANDACIGTDTVNGGSETLDDKFPNAEYGDPNDFDNNITDDLLCLIRPKIGRPNRNRGYKDGGGGDDGGPIFAETADMDNDASADTGVITAIADSLFNGNTYNLKSMDRLVFDHSNGSGMNMRMVKMSREFNENGGDPYIGNVMAAWNGTAWANMDTSTACQGGNPCWGPWDLIESFNFSDMTWASAQANGSLASAVNAASHVDFNVFYHQYAGPVPTQSQLDQSIDNERVHKDYNISGEKEFYVLTNGRPAYDNDGSNPCHDRDPATQCLDDAGNPISAVRLNLTLGAADSEGFKPITAIEENASGKIMLRPVWGYQGFSGVFELVNFETGRLVQDELMRIRALKLVFDAAECDGTSLPNGGAGCAAEKVYNVEPDWDGCNGPGDPCPAISTKSATAVTVTGDPFKLTKNYLQTWVDVSGNGSGPHFGFVSGGTWDNPQVLDVAVTVDGNGGEDTFAAGDGNGQIDGGEYGIIMNWDCNGGGGFCEPNGFVLVDSGGNFLSDAGCAGACSQDADYLGSGNPATIFPAATIEAIAVAGGGTVASHSTRYDVNSGPVRNPNFSCEAEPFFVDGNGNGRLDCGIVSGVSSAINGDTSYSGEWEFRDALNSSAIPAGTVLRPRENAFVYGDPIGTKKLLSNAFNGWFDGQHTIDQNTSFDSIQVFALIFLFFEADSEKHMEELCNGGAIGGTTASCDGSFVPVGPFDANFSLKNMNGTIGGAIEDFKTN